MHLEPALDVHLVFGAHPRPRRQLIATLAQREPDQVLPCHDDMGDDEITERATDFVAHRIGTSTAADAVVIECPDHSHPVHLGAGIAEGIRCALDLDASITSHTVLTEATFHLDLHGEDSAIVRSVIAQIEHAAHIHLVGTAPGEPARSAASAPPDLTLALLECLAPAAYLTHRHGTRIGRRARRSRHLASGPGWATILGGEFDVPEIVSTGRPDVSCFRYEQLRPFHPGRLQHVLDDVFDSRAYGWVVRSAGFCRLATRPESTAHWDQAGRSLSFEHLARDTEHDELLAIGQDLAFIGVDLDRRRLSAALDSCALDDSELIAGPSRWQQYADPFPEWLCP